MMISGYQTITYWGGWVKYNLYDPIGSVAIVLCRDCLKSDVLLWAKTDRLEEKSVACAIIPDGVESLRIPFATKKEDTLWFFVHKGDRVWIICK